MKIIEQKIKDRRFTDLIRKALKAGYMEFRFFKHSITGTPEGSIISPILSNIYLNELDKLVVRLKLDLDTGSKPKINPVYNRLRYLKSKETSPRGGLVPLGDQFLARSGTSFFLKKKKQCFSYIYI